MPFVVDCSMAIAWMFEDETSEKATALCESLLRDSAVVPTLWPIEVANVILAATRRGRIQQDQWQELIGHLIALPITIDNETPNMIFTASLPLAQSHGLSVYDAVYLELAIRKNLPLATLDNQLKNACISAGVQTL